MDIGITEKEIERRVTAIYQSPHLIQYPYHNLIHTQHVVGYTKEIASHYSLNGSDIFILTTAAWFHDIGHLYGEMQGHEERGARIMEQWLEKPAPDLAPPIR